MQGKAFEASAEGNIYYGYWSEDELHHGIGKMEYANGDEYHGPWQYGKRATEKGKKEKGIMKFHNGDVYEGEWANDMFEGEGIFKSGDGTRYKGTWKNGKKDGNAFIVEYGNGDRYEGSYLDDKMNGKSTLIFANGDRYEGKFNKGKYHGPGKMTNSAGVYEGNWHEGLKETPGGSKAIFNYSNGDVYEGNIFHMFYSTSYEITHPPYFIHRRMEKRSTGRKGKYEV